MANPEDRTKTAAAKPGEKAVATPAPAVVTPPAVAPAHDPYAQYYVVKKGDSLSKIAEEHYGDKMLYPKIFDANRDVLSDPNKIKPGQKLRIP